MKFHRSPPFSTNQRPPTSSLRRSYVLRQSTTARRPETLNCIKYQQVGQNGTYRNASTGYECVFAHLMARNGQMSSKTLQRHEQFRHRSRGPVHLFAPRVSIRGIRVHPQLFSRMRDCDWNMTIDDLPP